MCGRRNRKRSPRSKGCFLMFAVVCMFVFEMSSTSNTFCPLLDLESSSALSVEVPVDIKVKYVNWFKSGGMREIKKRSKKSRSDSLLLKSERETSKENLLKKNTDLSKTLCLSSFKKPDRSVLTTHLRSWAIMRAR